MFLNVSPCRCICVPCQYIRHIEQHGLLFLQPRHVLPGRHGHAVALSRRVLLPGRRRGLGCAASRMSRGVVLQRQPLGCSGVVLAGDFLYHGYDHTAHYVSEWIVLPDRGVECQRGLSSRITVFVSRHDDTHPVYDVCLGRGRVR